MRRQVEGTPRAVLILSPFVVPPWHFVAPSDDLTQIGRCVPLHLPGEGVFRQNHQTKGRPFVTKFPKKERSLGLISPLCYLKHCRNNLSPNPIFQLNRREFTQSVYKTPPSLRRWRARLCKQPAFLNDS